MPGRLCRCGCGASLDGRRKDAVWATDACRMRAARQPDTGTWRPSAASGPQTPNKARTRGRSGLQVSYPKAVEVLTARLATYVQAAGRCTEQAARDIIAAALAEALSDRQRAHLDTATVGFAPIRRLALDEDRTVATRIAAAHNQLRTAIRDGGVLSFSAEGRSVRPLPDDDQWGEPIDRIPFPVADRDVTADEVSAWLDNHRALQAEAHAQAQAAAEEAVARREIRRGERERNYGMTTGAVNCEQCGAFKSRPSATCGQCGDVPHRGDPDAYDIAHGYAPDAARAA